MIAWKSTQSLAGNPVGLFFCFLLSGVQASAHCGLCGFYLFCLRDFSSLLVGALGLFSFLGLSVSPPSRQALFAMVAQRQCSGFVIRRLRVQIPSVAPDYIAVRTERAAVTLCRRCGKCRPTTAPTLHLERR